MKRSVIGFVVVAMTLASTGLLVAQHGGHDHSGHKKSDVVAEEEIDARKVTGEIIDITCYLRHDSKGEKHTKCATYCANLGMPLGLLEDETGNIFLIIPPGHEDPKGPVVPFIGQRVTVEAILYTMGGLTGLEVEKITAL